MPNPVSLATSLVKYLGPDFKSANEALRSIRERRTENLEEQVQRDEEVTQQLTGNSDRPLTHPEVDDLALANPKLRMVLDRSSSNHAETDMVDHHTFVDEGKRISQLLERLSDGDIDQLRTLFLDILAKEGPTLLTRLEKDAAAGIREIMSTVHYLAFGVTPYVVEHDFTPDAQAKYKRLDPVELMTTVARKT